MNKRNILYFLNLFILLSIISCEDDIQEEYNDSIFSSEYIEVPIRFTIDEENTDDYGSDLSDNSRLITRTLSGEQESIIKDVWVIMIEETSGDQRPVLYKEYFTLEDKWWVSLPMVLDRNHKNRLLFIANTHDPSAFDDVKLNIDWEFPKIRDKQLSINSSIDCHNGNNRDLIMSQIGEHTIDKTLGSIGIDVKLKRSVAKIELNLSLDDADKDISKRVKQITSVQLRDVPGNLDYCDAFKSNNIVGYPNASSKFIDYEPITTGLPVSGGEAVYFKWYVPRNARGTIGGTNYNNRSKNAPEKSTYIEVTALDYSDNVIRYRIYPGRNLSDNYDIIGNHRYTMSVDLKGTGDPSVDSNITHFDEVDMRGKISNSYIINPGDMTRLYKIPITRVNEFWGDARYCGTVDNNKKIGDNDSWWVELVWMDEQGMLVKKNDNNNIYIEKSFGTGIDDCFNIVVPQNAKHGNFVVGIYRDLNGDGTRNISGNYGSSGYEQYLWSWHFWVTDYNPYGDMTKMNNLPYEYQFKVPGGELHRYEGQIWRSGEYAGKYAMDRNLGARSGGTTSTFDGKGSLYFQYGRKDPFPGDVSLYNYNGNLHSGNNSIPKWNSSDANSTNHQISINQSLDEILIFRSFNNDWLENSNNYIWNDINASNGNKSIFDPSPYGFKILHSSAFENFKINLVDDRTTNIGGTIDGFLEFDEVYGMQYKPRYNGNPINLTSPFIYYPKTANRSSSNGRVSNNNSHTYLWNINTFSNDASLGSSMRFIHKSNSNASENNNSVIISKANKSAGFQIRCVQE